MNGFLDLLGAILLLIGSLLCLGTAVTLVRFPDLLSKLHGITKPQVLGIIVIALGIALSLRTWYAVGICVLIVFMQLFTAPVAGTMVSRSAYRAGLIDSDTLVVDELAEDLADSGFAQRTSDDNQ